MRLFGNRSLDLSVGAKESSKGEKAEALLLLLLRKRRRRRWRRRRETGVDVLWISPRRFLQVCEHIYLKKKKFDMKIEANIYLFLASDRSLG